MQAFEDDANPLWAVNAGDQPFLTRTAQTQGVTTPSEVISLSK